MIECPSCGRQHRPGTLFCSECGVYLLTGGPLRTEPLPDSEKPASRADPWAAGAGPLEEEAQATLTLVVESSARQVPLTGSNEYVLGRLDATRGVFPVWTAAFRAAMPVSTGNACNSLSKTWGAPTAPFSTVNVSPLICPTHSAIKMRSNSAVSGYMSSCIRGKHADLCFDSHCQ